MTDASAVGPSHRLLTVLLGSLAMLGPFATDTYLPSLPALERDFHISALLAQQTLSIYLFAYSLMSLFWGTLSDTFGRRRIVLLALVIFTVGSIGAAAAPTARWLLAFRALQGCSAGAGVVTGQAMVRDLLTGAAAQRMIGNMMMVFGIAPAVAPVIGGWLQVSFGWRSSFFFMGLFGAVLLGACVLLLRESLPASQRVLFRPAAILANYATALHHSDFPLRCSSIAFGFGGFAIYIASAAGFVLHVLGLSETAFAWLFVPMIGGLVAGSMLSGRLAGRVPPETMIRRGFVIMGAAATLNLGYNALLQATVPWAVAPIMLYTFGLATALPSMTVRTLEIFPRTRGLAASLLNFFQMLVFASASGFVAPLLFHSALKLAAGNATAFLLAAGFWKLALRQSARVAATQGKIHG